MRHGATPAPERELDDFIRAYEIALACGERVDPRAFLPEPGHPLHAPVLRELVRIDLEHGWDHGRPRSLEDYRSWFPDLFGDPQGVREIAFEEYRLRRQAGQDPSPAEYESRFGVDTTGWPGSRPEGGTDDTAWPRATAVEDDSLFCSALLSEAALAYQGWRGRRPDPCGGPAWDGFEGSVEHAEFFDELHRADPAAADRLALAVIDGPRVAGGFAGFRPLAELGRGTFGRVYLARQGELADRLVVLKVVPHLLGESRALAQLQHTHIVPIYSVHRAGAYQAICMPFFGGTTLADIVQDLRRGGALPGSGAYLLDRAESRAREGPSAGATVPQETRAALGKLSYVEGVLWLALRLADGLAHAHARGIIHRDLKPANILLTDEGQPMLLDFNLSQAAGPAAGSSAARIGGTLPYMAPEQLAAFQEGTRPGDARGDLYSFGVILFELLTGQHPFPRPRGPMAEVLRQLRADRAEVPEVRSRNPAVSPAAQSIVRRCLEPEPSRRYQSAQELREDLQRQLDHRPLRHAPEPSLRERARKWARRHPRLMSSTGVGVVAALLLLATAGGLLLRLGHLARLKAAQDAQRARWEAVAAQQRLHGDLKVIETLLGTGIPEVEREQLAEGTALADQILARYRVLDAPDWRETSLVTALEPEPRDQLREDMGELLLLLAGAAARQDQAERALRLNALAEGCYPAGATPRALWRQRAGLARSTGRGEEARRLLERAEATRVSSARDRYLLLLVEHADRGQLQQALPFLQEASRRQKDSFSVWLVLGNCYAGLERPAEAIACYDLASALWPEAHWPYLSRGLVYLAQKDYLQARAAFDEAIRLRPEMQPAYYNRALARYHLGDLPGAEADLTRLLGGSGPPLRAYFLRAKVRDRAGDREGARRDREEGLRREPLDERDWTARGLARQPRDPKGALADFDRALGLNPCYRAALQDKANVLSEDLGRTEEAIGVLDEVVALYPDYVPARAGRGVLRARLGRREAAHADAREALSRDPRPFTAYQVAGLYALTSRQDPGDRREALRLLASALSRGTGLDLVDGDRDLDPIRDQPEFRRMVEAARALRPAGPPREVRP